MSKSWKILNRLETCITVSITKLGLMALAVGILLWIILPILLTSFSLFGIDFSNTGQIGDTIGGIASPAIGLISALLVFFALKAQVDANQMLKNENQRLQQQRDDDIKNSEIRYYIDRLSDISKRASEINREKWKDIMLQTPKTNADKIVIELLYELIEINSKAGSTHEEISERVGLVFDVYLRDRLVEIEMQLKNYQKDFPKRAVVMMKYGEQAFSKFPKIIEVSGSISGKSEVTAKATVTKKTPST